MFDFSTIKVFGDDISLAAVLGPTWPVLVVGFVTALIATPIARKLAFAFQILDMPNDTVKIHKKPTAYLGGLAVLAGFLIAVLIGFFYFLKGSPAANESRIVLAICGGAVLSTIVGLVDDIKDLRPWQKLLGQALCSLFLMLGNVRPDLGPIFRALHVAVSPGVMDILSYLIILFFVLGATNSLNLLDGLDGLCTGVTAIITIGFLFLEIHLATWATDPEVDPIRMIVAMALVGAALGFLFFNRHPAKIFLGDAGSILLGFIIAAMMMLFFGQNIRWWLASIVIFGLPILDTGTALIRRALNHRPLFVSDRGHIYDQMIDRGMSLWATVITNYLLAGMYATLGILSAIFLRTYQALFFDLTLLVVSFAVVGFKGYFRMSGYRGAVQKK
jgi:UDP-GlcNAc:undecaprenyl-phosphate GlcNAc-1-phosphate transferase